MNHQGSRTPETQKIPKKNLRLLRRAVGGVAAVGTVAAIGVAIDRHDQADRHMGLMRGQVEAASAKTADTILDIYAAEPSTSRIETGEDGVIDMRLYAPGPTSDTESEYVIQLHLNDPGAGAEAGNVASLHVGVDWVVAGSHNAIAGNSKLYDAAITFGEGGSQVLINGTGRETGQWTAYADLSATTGPESALPTPKQLAEALGQVNQAVEDAQHHVPADFYELAGK